MDLYDIEKDKWYSQSTSTDESNYPVKTLSGCAAIGSDGRTWEIYMYGGTRESGADLTDLQSRQDIWVLTLPAFHWFRIPTDHSRRILAGHECHIAGKQLITVSGGETAENLKGNESFVGIACMDTPFRVYDLEHLGVSFPLSFRLSPQGGRCAERRSEIVDRLLRTQQVCPTKGGCRLCEGSRPRPSPFRLA